jgi:putative peptidoglycan lipid II flippase
MDLEKAAPMTAATDSLRQKSTLALEEGAAVAGGQSLTATTASETLRSSLIYGSASFAAYALSMVKAIVVAKWFGTSGEMDAYTIAILIPNLAGALLSSTTAGAVVPSLVKASAEGEERRATVFRSSLVLFTAVCLALTLLMGIFAGSISSLFAASFDPYRREMTVKMMRAASGIVLLTGVYAFCSAELLSRRKFLLVGAAPAVSTAISIACIAIWHASGIDVLIWSLELGLAVQAVILLAPVWWSTSGARLWAWRDASVWQCFTSQGALLGAASVGVANASIDQMIAARMPAGNVSALSYAGSLNTGMMQLVVMALSWVALPELSALIAAQRMDAVRRRVRYCMLLAVVIAAPASAAVVAFGHEAVRRVFEHGLFTAQSTQSVFTAWLGYSVGLAPAAAGMIIVRLVNALGQNSLLFQIGLGLLAVNAALDYWLMQIWGLVGISLSTSFVYCLSVSALLIAMRTRVGRLLDRATVKGICLAAACPFAAIVPAIAVRALFGNSLVSVAVQAAVFCAALLAAYSAADLVRWSGGAGFSKAISLRLSLEEYTSAHD